MDELESVVRAEKAEEIRETLRAISSKMVLPLYFLFWLCDLLYLPEKKWEFLGLRLIALPLYFATRAFLARSALNYEKLQRFALVYTIATALPITFMIFLSGNWASPYYAGLNMVALGALSFIPFTSTYFALAIATIFLPFYAGLFVITNAIGQLSEVLVNSFFVVGTILISLVIRRFNDMMRRKEIVSRLKLRDEIRDRDRVIAEKSKEAVKLAALSNQFSPQVVEAIREGRIDVAKGVHRSQICALFIDIVNSTERVVRVDKDKVSRVLSMFMEDTIKTLLKYDITVDKFLGDGVLAFANDPMKYDDFTDRVVQAAIEVRERIALRQDDYIDYWQSEMQIRVGIAVGHANVGFYGNDRYYKSYTAIGPVVNLASRLCSSAEPNQIVASADVLERLDRHRYKVTSLGARVLKGFESDLIRVFEINPSQDVQRNLGEIDCPSCSKGLLFLDSDPNGIMIMKCRSCGYVHDGSLSPSILKGNAAS